jgi:GMP synthase-like glutamine amidotransferase
MSSERPGLILQHGDDGPAGILGDWLAERGIAHSTHATWRDPLPGDPGAYAWVATLGSEHTPGSPDAPAWVDAEIEFLREAMADDVPVLGLCFGGQALAIAAGGEVHRAEPAEIGWLEVTSSEPELIPAGPWLHYHYDQLEPPIEATTIAHSPSGPAAFTLGRSLGLQFHPESTPEIAAAWASLDPKLSPDEAERLAAEGAAAAAEAEAAAKRLFDAWWQRSLIAPPPRMGTLSTAPRTRARAREESS